MRFQSLDGWRGIAALLVSLYHLGFLNHLYHWDFLRNSYLFVDFFFVLSGFVMAHAYRDKLGTLQESMTFISRRISRLLPLHFFVLLLFVGMELLKLIMVQQGSWSNDTAPFTQDYSIPSLISNLFLLQSMGIHDHFSWNYPSWSISVEFYTYLIFALVLGISFKFKQSQPLRFAQYGVLIAASLIILYFNTDDLSVASYQFGIFRCVAGFFLGSICYELFLKRKALKIPHASLLESSLLIAIYLFIVYAGDNKFSLFAPLIFAVTVFVFSYEQGAISQGLKTKGIQNLGKWSYSIYMLHAFIILVIERGFSVLEGLFKESFATEVALSSEPNIELIYFGNLYLMDLLTIVYLLVLVYFASITYKNIELKGNQLFKGLLTRRDAPRRASVIKPSLSE